jgi:NADPH-dependent 2,4-dienoyl-CoA reductase/sulfur reductase-like enzyme
VVVIGGVAAGMSAAMQVRRRTPETEVVVLERGQHVSYGACGMPYVIADAGRSMEELVVLSPRVAREKRGVDLRLGHEVVSIDTAGRKVTARSLETGSDLVLHYDRLVIATGASPIRPPWPGVDSPGVFVLRDLNNGIAVHQFLAEHAPKRAVVVGAGYIGMEMAEVLRDRGLEVTVLEKLPHVVPGFHPAIAAKVHETLTAHGVEVHTDVTVERIEKDEDGLRVVTNLSEHAADLVLVAIGIRPNVKTALEARIELGETGAIAVDAACRTSAPDVYAAGDCAEAFHRVIERPVWIPLGTTANKQGKVAGANAAGDEERFAGIVGTATFKVFDLEVARTGLGPDDVARYGVTAVEAQSEQNSRAHGYPQPARITTVVWTDPKTRRVLGAQMVGREGVAKRIDVFATALTAKMTIDQVEELDLSYAPPFAPVWDPVLIAAQVARKAIEK